MIVFQMAMITKTFLIKFGGHRRGWKKVANSKTLDQVEKWTRFLLINLPWSRSWLYTTTAGCVCRSRPSTHKFSSPSLIMSFVMAFDPSLSYYLLPCLVVSDSGNVPTSCVWFFFNVFALGIHIKWLFSISKSKKIIIQDRASLAINNWLCSPILQSMSISEKKQSHLLPKLRPFSKKSWHWFPLMDSKSAIIAAACVKKDQLIQIYDPDTWA